MKLGLRGFVFAYLGLLLLVPVGMVFYRALEKGLGPPVEALTTPEAQHALYLTALVVLITVPLNTVFGVITALALARRRFPGRGLVDRMIDLPFAVSPVIVGLALVLVYGQNGWAGGALADLGVQVIFSTPGIVLATIFVSLPFVVREVTPVLAEIGTEQEEAAHTLGASPWQTFRRITFPAIKPAVFYGVILTTARALGEFGAVTVVSGRLRGETETMTLFVQDRFERFDVTGAYAAAVLLALIALGVLFSMTLLNRRRALHGN